MCQDDVVTNCLPTLYSCFLYPVVLYIYSSLQQSTSCNSTAPCPHTHHPYSCLKPLTPTPSPPLLSRSIFFSQPYQPIFQSNTVN
uniref:Uncharacterized protein n=1 Tax=Octopus bimaculoides TaxID=37653 RepID=A0A0L8I6R0_OCTBM